MKEMKTTARRSVIKCMFVGTAEDLNQTAICDGGEMMKNDQDAGMRRINGPRNGIQLAL
jgi:hypothetical protein